MGGAVCSKKIVEMLLDRIYQILLTVGVTSNTSIFRIPLPILESL
jgi:hypothetical protein